MKKSKDQIPAEFKSIEQIQDFWNTHSSADYWAEMEDVPMKLSPESKAKLELKKLYRLLSLSKTQIKAIERKAQSAKVDARRLMSKWITAQI